MPLYQPQEILGLCQKTRMLDYGKTDPLTPPAPSKLPTAFYVCERDCLEVLSLLCSAVLADARHV